jgi:hypothetical protein
MARSEQALPATPATTLPYEVLTTVFYRDYQGQVWRADYIRPLPQKLVLAGVDDGQYLWGALVYMPANVDIFDTEHHSEHYLLRICSVIRDVERERIVLLANPYCQQRNLQTMVGAQTFALFDEEWVAKHFSAPWRRVKLEEVKGDNAEHGNDTSGSDNDDSGDE